MSALHYPLALPAPGESLPVAPGVHWLRLPLPFALDHINLWLLEDGDGWLLVDTGLGGEHTQALWRRYEQGVLAGRPVRRILVTHYHPDHIGQAAWLAQRWSAPVLITAGEWALARSIFESDDAAAGAAFAQLFARHGLDAGRSEALRERGNAYRRGVAALPEAVELVAEGDTLQIDGRRWQIIVGRGHAPEHACLFCPELDLLISGDQVLPRISSNVSVRPSDPGADPVGEFLASLRRLAELPRSVRVLPAHGRVFEGLHARLRELEGHHARQLDTVAQACAGAGRTAAELLDVMFARELNLHTLMFAMGEAIAHLNHLQAQGRVVGRPDEGGVLRYHAG